MTLVSPQTKRAQCSQAHKKVPPLLDLTTNFTMNMMCFPSSQEKSKTVSFYGTVTVIYIPPINKLLKKELFYRRDDFQIFELEAYMEAVQKERIQRQRQGEECDEDDYEDDEYLQQYVCKDPEQDLYDEESGLSTPLPLDPSLHDRHQAAIAA